MTWTDERVELLKKLWADGLSASQIAAQLGGVTPQCGHRQGAPLSLSGRAKPAGAPSQTRTARKPLRTAAATTARAAAAALGGRTMTPATRAQR